MKKNSIAMTTCAVGILFVTERFFPSDRLLHAQNLENDSGANQEMDTDETDRVIAAEKEAAQNWSEDIKGALDDFRDWRDENSGDENWRRLMEETGQLGNIGFLADDSPDQKSDLEGACIWLDSVILGYEEFEPAVVNARIYLKKSLAELARISQKLASVQIFARRTRTQQAADISSLEVRAREEDAAFNVSLGEEKTFVTLRQDAVVFLGRMKEQTQNIIGDINEQAGPRLNAWQKTHSAEISPDGIYR